MAGGARDSVRLGAPGSLEYRLPAPPGHWISSLGQPALTLGAGRPAPSRARFFPAGTWPHPRRPPGRLPRPGPDGAVPEDAAVCLGVWRSASTVLHLRLEPAAVVVVRVAAPCS